MRTNPPSAAILCRAPDGVRHFFAKFVRTNHNEMKKYESPFCEMEIIEQEESFLSVTASSDDYPVTQVDPFHSRGLGEEDGDE